MDMWIRDLIALVVAAHGLVYLATPLTSISANIFQGWKGSSAVLGTTVSTDALKSLTSWLWVLAGIGLLAAAAAIAFTSLVPGIWRPIATGAALVGVVSFAVFWDGQLDQWVNEGGIGLVISLTIAAGASTFPEAFG